MLFDYRAPAVANQRVTALRLTKDADERE